MEHYLVKILWCLDKNKWDLDFSLKPILDTCAELTREYDESHDVNHHVNVAINSIEIFSHTDLSQWQMRNIIRLKKIVLYASLLHDTIDHKYPVNIEEKKRKLDSFLREKLGIEWMDTKWVIDNISYSKEVKNGYPVNSDPVLQLARNIVSDADKLEAIGETGITRVKQFNRASNPLATEEQLIQIVVDHCHEKLFKLKNNFIRTSHGKLMAEPLHEVLVKYVNLHTKK